MFTVYILGKTAISPSTMSAMCMFFGRRQQERKTTVNYDGVFFLPFPLLLSTPGPPTSSHALIGPQ